MRRNGFCGLLNVAEVWFVMIIQRGRNANDDCVHLGDMRIINGRRETTFLSRLNIGLRDADDIRSALGEHFHLFAVNVKTGDPELLLAEQQNERKAYVAKSYDSYAGGPIFNLAFEQLCTANGLGLYGCHNIP